MAVISPKWERCIMTRYRLCSELNFDFRTVQCDGFSICCIVDLMRYHQLKSSALLLWMLLTFFVLTSTSSVKNNISRENNSGCCIRNKCLCNNNAYRHIIIALGATLWITTTMSTSDNAGGGLNDLCHDLFLIFLKSKSSVQNSSSSS